MKIKTTIDQKIPVDVEFELPPFPFYRIQKNADGVNAFMVNEDSALAHYPFSVVKIDISKYGVRTFRSTFSEREMCEMWSESEASNAMEYVEALKSVAEYAGSIAAQIQEGLSA